MVLIKENKELTNRITASTKRRIRRHKLKSALYNTQKIENKTSKIIIDPFELGTIDSNKDLANHTTGHAHDITVNKENKEQNMSANENKSREDVLAARHAKKQAKQQKGGKNISPNETEKIVESPSKKELDTTKEIKKETIPSTPKGKDEVDKAAAKVENIGDCEDKNKEQIKAERAAKKAAKQAKKKSAEGGSEVQQSETLIGSKSVKSSEPSVEKNVSSKPINEDMTVKDVVETLRDIANVVKEINDVTVKVKAIDLGGKKEKADESGKSKAELKAERRAKQEAQRAAKEATEKQKVAAKPKPEAKRIPEGDAGNDKEEKPAKLKPEKLKPKSQSSHRVNWFQHLYKDHNKESLKTTAINSNLHPAIIKLGVQLASRVVTGSNARCVALLDALKKMVRDYTLPAKTEFARGLESHLKTSLDYLWAMRSPSASQMNAVKFFRYHLTQMPNNVDEFDAKKTLAEEIDRYIREQIDMAGEAISIAVRKKISNGDNILTYGCSSLIERILRDAWSSGLQFRTVVVGNRVHSASTQMLRRLVARGLPCTYVDITALGMVMKTITKVVLGAGALLVNGSVLGAAGTAQVALAARAGNVPVLVACETHKFSERVQTDAFVYNEIGDPDDLIDKSDENSPLKDWRSSPNLTPLNLTYDVTPASLVTAVVTELAILPCTSAPVVLRFKLSEYSV